MNTLPIIIDTDPGIGEPGSVLDDGLAIALALASPELEILGLTIVNGNVDADAGLRSAAGLVKRLGHGNIPVTKGAPAPLKQDMNVVWDRFGMTASSPKPSPIKPTENAAAQWLVETTRERRGQVTVLAIGPLTNIAHALELDPEFATNVKRILVMAGNATGGTGDLIVEGDFNILIDPEAADLVVRSGAPVQAIGIDQTRKVSVDLADVAWLRQQSSNTTVTWIADCVQAWMGGGDPAGSNARAVCHLHDPLVIAAAIMPAICTFARAQLSVDIDGGWLHSTQDTAGTPAATAEVAIDTDVTQFRRLFLERLAQL